ncbi:internal scaffolding protein [Dipodfec virus RodF1_53]|uniref:Internal scaffolding protein n=1 Tax=Dipodfec virus RodF1_53 TaxID=2929302 RepID=A0A976N338_9VIRU|nr:internal scaffolding protein [Dipodfec virus RodF1_53]
MPKQGFRNRFSPHEDYGLVFTEPSLTEQSLYDDVNIHSLVRRGMNALPANTSQPMYNINLSQIGDYQSILQRSADLKNSFEELPLEVRKKFASPEDFLEFCEDRETNYEEGVKLGIFSEKGEPSIFEKSIEKISNFFEKNPSLGLNTTPEVISPSTGDNNLCTSAS